LLYTVNWRIGTKGNKLFDDTYQILLKWKANNHRLLSNGTMQIGKATAIALEAWVHTLYAPMSEASLVELEDNLGCNFDESMREFYKLHNGLDLFGGKLSIYGMPTVFTRTGDEAIQPYDFIDHNLFRPDSYPKNAYIIGAMSLKKDTLDILSEMSPSDKSGTIYVYSRKDEKYIFEWNTIFECLLDFCSKLENLMDLDGKITDEDKWNEFHHTFNN
jgi:hypothetical protein